MNSSQSIRKQSFLCVCEFGLYQSGDRTGACISYSYMEQINRVRNFDVTFLWFVGNLFSFCFVFVSFNSNRVYGAADILCSVCVCVPSPSMHWAHSTHLPQKYTFTVARINIVVWTGLCTVLMAMNSGLPFHLITNSPLMRFFRRQRQRKGSPISLFYVSRDFAAHTNTRTNANHIMFFSLIRRNQNNQHTNVFHFIFFGCCCCFYAHNHFIRYCFACA